MSRMNWGVSEPEDRNCSVVWLYSSRYLRITCQTTTLLCRNHLKMSVFVIFPPAKIVSSAKDVVTTAKDAVTGTVSGAKDTVSDTLTSAVEKTRGAVQDRVEKTRAVVSGSVSTVLESRVAQLVSSGVDTALSTSESLVEQYLPLTEDELGEWGWPKPVRPSLSCGTLAKCTHYPVLLVWWKVQPSF